MEAYCVKCRTKREMSNAQAITMKNGRPAKDVPDWQSCIVRCFLETAAEGCWKGSRCDR